MIFFNFYFALGAEQLTFQQVLHACLLWRPDMLLIGALSEITYVLRDVSYLA